MTLINCTDIDRSRNLDIWSGSKDDMKVTSRKTVPVAFLRKRFMPPPPSHRTHEAGALSVAAMALTSCDGIDRGRNQETWSGSKNDNKVTSRKTVLVGFCKKRLFPPPTIPPPP